MIIKIRLASILIISLLLETCNILGGNHNEIIQEKLNCSNKNKAVLFIKYAGATSDNSIQLAIIDSRIKIKDELKGNIFIADSDHGNTTIDSSSLDFRWLSCDTLLIKYDSRLRIFNQQTRFKTFVIDYKTK